MEVVFALIIFFVLVFLFSYVILFLFTLMDDISIAVWQRPLFIHWYWSRKTITPQEAQILHNQFDFYRKLSNKHKAYFHHRLASFTEKYAFISRSEAPVTYEMQTLIAGTYIMLTFGMRRYLVDVFDKILIYPEEYYSDYSENYHKGEFNPRLKAVVFSWKHFTEGYQVANDNLNLGIHEFSHVIHHHCLTSNDGSSLAFRKHYNALREQVNHPPNRQRLIDSDYFRIYAFTNQFEFISVIIEHYFETPAEFERRFPELFQLVSKMLNHKH